MPLVYYIPETGGHDLLQQRGLAGRFVRRPAVHVMPRGPDGGGGTAFATDAVPPDLQWHVAPDAGWWVGIPTPRPTPAAHLRPRQTATGLQITLGDGQDWVIPLLVPCTARDPQRAMTLPQAPRRAGPALVWRPRSEYDALVRTAHDFLAAFLDPAAPPVPQPQVLAYCVAVLGIFYRLGEPEILALDLLTPDTAQELVLATIDAAERALSMLDASAVRE